VFTCVSETGPPVNKSRGCEMAKPSLDSLSPGQQPVGSNTSMLSSPAEQNKTKEYGSAACEMKFTGREAGYTRWDH
jgi:hypothetical protein